MIFLYAQPFEDRLFEQTEILRQLTTSYDQGAVVMVKLIATTAGTIVDLLAGQEGGNFIRDRNIKFPTPIDPKGSGKKVSPLADLRVFINDQNEIINSDTVPIFKAVPPPKVHLVRLGKWKSERVHWTGPDAGLSREALISTMRNDDGGAHPYKDPGHAYRSLARGRGALSILMGGAPYPHPPGHFSAMRQIGHELLEALQHTRGNLMQ